MNASFKDFEDALQNYAAELNKTIDVIIIYTPQSSPNGNTAVYLLFVRGDAVRCRHNI
jgi:hypothetical protein